VLLDLDRRAVCTQCGIGADVRPNWKRTTASGKPDRRTEFAALVVSGSEADDEAIAFPDFNGVSVVNPSCLKNGRLIVWAVNEDGRLGNVAVFSNDIDAIFRHGRAPFFKAGALPNSQSPMPSTARCR